MRSAPNQEIAAWESEGGSPASAPVLSGTENQVEWAERIRLRVDAEFDRVAASFRSIATSQTEEKRANTEAILAILEDKRVEVMGKKQAGYFIRDWQEIGGQVRQMISGDPRYEAIKTSRQRLKALHASTGVS